MTINYYFKLKCFTNIEIQIEGLTKGVDFEVLFVNDVPEISFLTNNPIRTLQDYSVSVLDDGILKFSKTDAFGFGLKCESPKWKLKNEPAIADSSPEHLYSVEKPILIDSWPEFSSPPVCYYDQICTLSYSVAD